MADIGEVSAQVEQSLNTERTVSIARALAYAGTQITQMSTELAVAFDGSENRHAEELQELLGKLAAGLEQANDIIPRISRAKDDLLDDWTGSGQHAQPAKTAKIIIIPSRRKTPTGTEPMFDTERNYFDLDTQRHLNATLDSVITPEAVGKNSARAILFELKRHGQATVRDVLSSGSDAIASGLSPEQLQDLQYVLEQYCPGMPLRKMLTTIEVARFNQTVDHLPIQAVLPDYVHPEGERVTIGQVYDTRLRLLKKTARGRFADNPSYYQEEFRMFVDGFNHSRQRLEKHNRGARPA